METEGIMDEMRRLRSFETPAQKTKRKARANAKRNKNKFRFTLRNTGAPAPPRAPKTESPREKRKDQKGCRKRRLFCWHLETARRGLKGPNPINGRQTPRRRDPSRNP